MIWRARSLITTICFPLSFPLLSKLSRVKKEKVEKWCAENKGLEHFEVSAKEAISVEKAFVRIAQLGLQNENDEDLYIPEAIDMGGTNEAATQDDCAC